METHNSNFNKDNNHNSNDDNYNFNGDDEIKQQTKGQVMTVENTFSITIRNATFYLAIATFKHHDACDRMCT